MAEMKPAFRVPETVADVLSAQARLRPDAPAIEALDRAPLTYAGLARQTECTRHALRSFGIRPTDRVAVVLPDGPEAAVMFLSLATCAIAAPLNPAYRSAEFASHLDNLAVRAVIVLAGSTGGVVEVARARGIDIIEMVARGVDAGTFELFCESHAVPARDWGSVEPDAVALLLETSGTTARPKLVPLTHLNLCASARNNASVLNLGPLDRCLSMMPLFHIHGLVRPVLSSLTTGGAVVCTPGFQAPRFLGWLQAHRPTWYTASPTIHRAILDQAVKQGSTPVPSSLRFIRSSSEAMPPSLMIDIERVFGVPVIGGYGMTETSGQIACNPLPPQVRKPGSVGTAAGPEVAMIDENGLQLGAGHVGEIVVRGPSVMRGYERNPEANAAAFANGWLRTGDQGYRDEEGYIFITGRIKEIINRGGEKIAPREIDDVLLEHSSVAQAVTFGMPDRRLGETVAAAVVLKSGALVTERQLREFVAARIAFFKVPYRIVFLDELPKGPTGKIQRVGLAARWDLSEVRPAAEATSVQPRTSFERELAQLWTATLGVSDVGVHDDFFELGGTSISAVQVLFEVRRHFGVDLPAAELFRSRTIASLANTLEERRRGVSTPVARTGPREVRPMTETERRLAVVWERVLGMRGIGIGDNFFDLGGQSQHVARLFAEIQTVFGEGLPVRALNQEPTIEGLARIIDGTERSESTLIVPLQPDGSRPPLFVIHAGAGYVFFYRALAFRLGPDVPCYAVQAQGHFGRRERPFAPSRSVEQLAARYIREIKTVQRRGPYNLAGASFGGTVAFEMARQLRAEGEKVNSLILLSARVRNNPYIAEDAAVENSENRPLRHRIRTYVLRLSRFDRAAVKGVGGKIAGHLSHLWRRARLALRSKLEEVRRECDWQWRLLWRRPVPAELINARFMKASRSLMSRYRPDQYDGRILFFRAAADKDPIPLWTGLALDGIEVYDTPGGHLEMLDEPTVGSVADLIRTHMARADPYERFDVLEEQEVAHLTSAAS